MIGQRAVVVDAIKGPHGRGHVRIAGEDWPALTRDGSRVAEGEAVTVVDIEGATLLVEVPRPSSSPPWSGELGPLTNRPEASE